MGNPLRLDKMLTEGYLVKLYTGAGEKRYNPPPNKRWLIISGTVTHVNGTDSILWLVDADNEAHAYNSTQINTDHTSGTYPLFNTHTTDGPTADHGAPFQTQAFLWLVEPGMRLHFTGAATAECHILVIEW